VIERTYTTPDRHHNQMEPHATTAVWDADDSLTLYDTTQHLYGTRELVSIVLGIPQEKITIISEFLGGGFGGKAYVWPHTLLAALAAKVGGRPVKLQLTRAQMYSMVGHQAATIQTIALGAQLDGTLTGIRHESISATAVFDNYIEHAALSTRHLWAVGEGISTNHRIVHANRNTPTAMRSPTRRSVISRSRAPWTNSRTPPASTRSCAVSGGIVGGTDSPLCRMPPGLEQGEGGAPAFGLRQFGFRLRAQSLQLGRVDEGQQPWLECRGELQCRPRPKAIQRHGQDGAMILRIRSPREPA
jgi:hypothetical protein